MTFDEPKLEYVEIDLSVDTSTASCQEYGVETCLGTAPMNDCNEQTDFL